MELFEAELARRGLHCSAASSPREYVVWAHGARLVVSLDNLTRQLTGAVDDAQRVSWFVDQVIAASRPASLTVDGLYWFLEPRAHQDDAGYREPVSRELDRVLVHAGAAGALVRWMTARALAEMGLSADAASRHAWSGLDTALAQAEQVSYPAPGARPCSASLPPLPAQVDDDAGCNGRVDRRECVPGAEQRLGQRRRRGGAAVDLARACGASGRA